ncbi:hypothetical protein T06_11629 [Trichinella sp. T6]|nr:hypothetical protein T06_11629 [Trichinella sp. T6]
MLLSSTITGNLLNEQCVPTKRSYLEKSGLKRSSAAEISAKNSSGVQNVPHLTCESTSGLKLLKSKKEQITRVPLKYDEGKAQIQIQELCNTVCSQYSEEYLQLKKGTEPVDNARVQKAQAKFVTCHLNTSGLKLLKSKKEQITRVPLKYDEGKAQIQIQELCNTVCSQYSEEYLQLKKGTEPVDNARVQKAQAKFVTCHLNTSGLKLLKSKKEQITRVPLKYDEGKAQIQIQELCNTVCSQYSEEYLQLKKGTEPVDNARVQKAQAKFVTCHLKCSLSIKAQLKSLQ